MHTYVYGLTTEQLLVNLETTTVQLRMNYEKTGHITDGNNGVLHHFYDYVYGVIRYATLTFFGPYRISYEPWLIWCMQQIYDPHPQSLEVYC